MNSADALQTSLSAARTHLEDLQAEIEAGLRCAERIQADASTLDERRSHIQQTITLRRSTAALKASIQQQRGILRDLRTAIDHMRRMLRDRR